MQPVRTVMYFRGDNTVMYSIYFWNSRIFDATDPFQGAPGPLGVEVGHGHGVAEVVSLGEFGHVELATSGILVGGHLIHLFLLPVHQEDVPMQSTMGYYYFASFPSMKKQLASLRSMNIF